MSRVEQVNRSKGKKLMQGVNLSSREVSDCLSVDVGES
jgi:hypothetical protein